MIAEGLYDFKAHKHIIFYTIAPSGTIEIIRILHELMDLRNKVNK